MVWTGPPLAFIRSLMPRMLSGLAATMVCALGVAAGAVIVAVPSAAVADQPGIRINEIESSGGAPGDWIELYNPSDAPIMLDGYVVKDSDDTHVYTFPTGTTVAPGAFLVLDELKDNVGNFDFGLGGGDSVRLFDASEALVDEYAWTAHAATTWGVNDADEWALMSEPTKGAVNTFVVVDPEPEPSGSTDPEPTASDVVVNEIYYDEVSGYSDRIELFNRGAEAVDLAGWRVSDDKRDEFGTLPTGTTIAAGGFLLLVKDTDFPFGLGKMDEVVLYDASGTEVDAYAYENTAPLAVWARCPDGTDAWAPATVATPGAANDCATIVEPGSILINEIDSQPADWVEFYNPGTETLDISGYEIRDNSDDHRWQFPVGASIGGGEYLVVDETTSGLSGGAPSLFTAAVGIGSADRIRLYDASLELIDDSEPWSAHAAIDGDAAAATLARCPDGVGPFVLAYPTPGAANSCVLPDVQINEIESNGDTTDWIEIINMGSAAVDLSGWSVMDSDPVGHAAETTPLPSGTTLAPGALFVFDQPTNFVFGLGGGDTVTLRNAQNVTVAENAYPAHAKGVWARCADGVGDFVDLGVSTKGLLNACGNPVRINEVESDGGEPGDWIELVNPTSTPLDVSGIVVKDDDDTHAYEIPADTTIPAFGYLVIEGETLGFGLGKDDTVRLFEGDALRDSTTWGADHAATTWGRCPDTSGPFAVTDESTKGAANVCVGEIPVGAWPGSADVTVLDEAPMFLVDSSGLDTQATSEGTLLWAVDNGTGTFWKLKVGANGSVTFADGWADGKRARFERDASNPSAAGPDTEGITVGGAGWVYLASERDNSAKGVNQNVVLRVDPNAPGPDVVATQEWDLTAQLPSVGANLGIEAVEWVADGDLTGLVDGDTKTTYDPSRYPGHGDGLFFVAVEDGGGVFAFALNSDGTSKLVATLDPGLSGVMALDYDTVLDVLWAVCDDGCDGTAAQITLNGTAEPSIAHFARPASMPNGNNEGFATAPSSVAGFARAAWWLKDGEPSGSLRTGTVPGGAVDPGTPGGPGAGNPGMGNPGMGNPGAGNPGTGTPGTPGLPQTGSGAPLAGEQLVEANNGDVTAPMSAEPGGRVSINTGAQNAGTSVTVWMYSTPVQIASGTLDSAGRITVTIPANATLGMHRLAVYAADGELLGWTSIRIVTNGSLAETGSGADSSALGIALLLMLAGLTAIVVRRRVRTA